MELEDDHVAGPLCWRVDSEQCADAPGSGGGAVPAARTDRYEIRWHRRCPWFAIVWFLALHLQLNGPRPQCSLGSVCVVVCAISSLPEPSL